VENCLRKELKKYASAERRAGRETESRDATRIEEKSGMRAERPAERSVRRNVAKRAEERVRQEC
jgi:hypothetical protein